MERSPFEDSWRDALKDGEATPSKKVWSAIQSELTSAGNIPFEDRWNEALKGVEATPSAKVWSAIESDLAAVENIRMRKSIGLYRRVAAAAVLVAFLASAFSIYYYNIGSNSGGASRPVATGGQPAQNNSTESPDQKQSARTENQATALNENETAAGSGGQSIKKNNALAATEKDKQSPPPSDIQEIQYSAVPVNLQEGAETGLTAEPVYFIAKENTDPSFKMKYSATDSIAAPDETKKDSVVVKATPAKDSVLTPVVVATKIEKVRGMWISAGASAGSYNAGIRSSGSRQPSIPTAAVMPGFSAIRTHAKPGTFYSAGILIGGRIFPRWVAQGGVTYLNETARFTTDYVNMNSSVAVPGITTSFAVASPTGTYTPTCTMQYISIPVQAGYVLKDGGLMILVNTGVSPNIFVLNTLRDPSGNVKPYSEGPGSKSAYRNVSWSGLLNAEIGLRMSGRYSLSFVPGIRYAISSALKSGADRPFVADIGFRMRYRIH